MNKQNIPNHIGILIDGNRRWAKSNNFSVDQGHEEGAKNFFKICEYCWSRGIKIVSGFLFSTENWGRDKKEVDFLMELFEKFLKNKRNINIFKKHKVRVKIIGQKERFPRAVRIAAETLESLTKNNNNFQLNLAISYGGRWDIIEAVKKIINKKISAEDIAEETIKENLSTGLIQDPDLIIRTSGEQRISNFLIWQGAYSELYFPQKMWPDFKEKDLDEAINEYNRRQRRFGK